MPLSDLTIFSSYHDLAFVCVVILISQFIYSTIGFGSGMIAISLFALAYGRLDVFIPFFILICLPAEGYISIKEWRRTELKTTLLFLGISAPTIILGSFLLKSKGEEPWIIIALGIVITFIALYFLIFEEFKPIPLDRDSVAAKIIVASLSGILGGLYAISGPPLIIYFRSIGLGKREFRAALMSIYFGMSIIRIASYIPLGMIPLKMLVSCLMALPFVLAGIYLGDRLHSWMPERIFKRAVSFILLVSGLMLILKNF